jgi:glycosyltransferase involved in cell wall biosynthesis
MNAYKTDLPLVSVVTVCLNAATTIRRSIESVLGQNYRPLEYIVIDGGSTDGTLDIIYEYKNVIHFFSSDRDLGISDAFNKGIMASQGNYIQLLNADDWLPPDKIEISVGELENNPKAAYVFGDLIIIDENDVPCMRIAGDPTYAKKISKVFPRLNHPTLLVRSEIYRKYGLFDLTLRIAMDYDWLLRIHCSGEYGIYSPNVLVFMRDGGASSNWTKSFKEQLHVAVHHGCGHTTAWMVYLYCNARTLIRNIFERFLPAKITYKFRPGKTPMVNK